MNAREYLDFLQATMAPCDAELSIRKADLIEWGEFRSNQFDNPVFKEVANSFPGFSPSEMQTEFVTKNILPYLIKALPNKVQSMIKSIPVGVLPLRTVNACAAKAPNGDPFLILDSGLFSMTHFYQETQATIAAIIEERGIKEAEKYLMSAYKFIVNYFEKSGGMSFPKPESNIKLPLELIFFATIKAVAIESFVLSHEICHVLAGDLDQKDEVTMVEVDNVSDPISFYKKSQEQELLADLLGFLLYQEACDSIPLLKHCDPQMIRIIPLEFFQITGLIEKNIKTHDEYSSHPSTEYRVGNLIAEIDKLKLDEETYNIACEVAKIALTMPKIKL